MAFVVNACTLHNGALISLTIGILTYADGTTQSHPGVARLIVNAAKDGC